MSISNRFSAIFIGIAIAAFRHAAMAYPGQAEAGFNPNASNVVRVTPVQPDGKVFVGGRFDMLSGVEINRLARLNADGTLDSGFNSNADGQVICMTVLPDGKTIVGGEFMTVTGVTRRGIARIHANGSLDTSFNLNVDGTVTFAAVQNDQKILIGGYFFHAGGAERRSLARINANGTLDPGFDPDPDGNVGCAAVQPDGKIIIGGSFNAVGGYTRNYIARLNANGTVDTGFNPNANLDVSSVVIQPDGKILIVGQFTTVGGIARNYVARLNANGTVDMGYDPKLNRLPGVVFSGAYALALQTDGAAIIGGHFATAAGPVRNYLLRIKPDGTPDEDFNPNANYDIYGLALQADGKVLASGDFTAVGGAARNYVARLKNGPATQSLTATTSSRVQWLRGGTSPEVGQVSFELSTDGGAVWTSLGAGTRITDGWELAGLNLPASGQIHARGLTGGSSSSLMETRASFTVSLEEPFRILSAVLSGGNLLITFPTVTGLKYTLWQSDSMADGWSDAGLPFNVGDDTNQVFTVAAPVTGIPKRFYRVQALP